MRKLSLSPSHCSLPLIALLPLSLLHQASTAAEQVLCLFSLSGTISLIYPAG